MQAARRAPLRFLPAVWLVALLVAGLDQASKLWAINHLTGGGRVDVIGDWLGFELVYNSGAAFSLLNGATWVVTVVMLAVTGALIWYHGRASGKLAIGLFGAALGGAIGNLIDRLVRDDGWGTGAVVDMINYGNQFVGNVADIAIVGAATVAVLASWRGVVLVEPQPPSASPDASSPAQKSYTSHTPSLSVSSGLSQGHGSQ